MVAMELFLMDIPEDITATVMQPGPTATDTTQARGLLMLSPLLMQSLLPLLSPPLMLMPTMVYTDTDMLLPMPTEPMLLLMLMDTVPMPTLMPTDTTTDGTQARGLLMLSPPLMLMLMLTMDLDIPLPTDTDMPTTDMDMDIPEPTTDMVMADNSNPDQLLTSKYLQKRQNDQISLA